MKILLSGARSPVVLEWIEIFKNHEIILLDFSPFALCFHSHKNLKKLILPSPKLDFYHFKNEIFKLFLEMDFVIANCEEIFYFAMARDDFLRHFPNSKIQFFFCESKLLFNLHNKYQFFSFLPQTTNICFPKTKIIQNKFELTKIKNLDAYILKPVFSRFGAKVIREIGKKDIENLELNSLYPYVLQEKLKGLNLCNYGIFHQGKLLVHSLYIPKYLINNSAGSYFTPIKDENLLKISFDFMVKFGEMHNLNGQFAFDFILQNNCLHVLECNPRATSGLHLVAKNIKFEKDFQTINTKISNPNYRIGISLFVFFSLKSLKEGKFLKLLKDYQNAKDILDKIPIKASFISLFGLFYTAFKHKIKLSDASTFDIEFNGRLDERNLDFCYTQTFSQKFIQSFSIPSETCIRNLYVDFKTYKQVYKNHTITFLLSKNTKNTPNTFNASLYGLIIQYAKDEINKLNSKSLRFISFMLIYFFTPIVRYIDRLIFIDNYFFSTNLFENYYEDEEFLHTCLENLLAQLKTSKEAITFRSVNAIQNPRLFNFLKKQDFYPIITRQIYYMNDFSLLEQSRDYKKDKKLLEQKEFYFKKADKNSDFNRIKELYDMLYLQKYSIHNIQFQAHYIQKMCENNLIEIYILYEEENIVGFLSFLENEVSLTIPFIGYDLNNKKPLYRILQAFILETAKRKNKFLNKSNGASFFKTSRRMQPCFEYTFVYTKHLNPFKQICFKILSFISIKFYGKILKHFKF